MTVLGSTAANSDYGTDSRQREKQTGREPTERKRESRKTEAEAGRQKDGGKNPTERETDRQRDKHREKQRNRPTDGQRDRNSLEKQVFIATDTKRGGRTYRRTKRQKQP